MIELTQTQNEIAQSFFKSPAVQQTNELLMMWLTLSADAGRLEEHAKGEKSQNSFHRRQYVRAAAALVEGFTSMMKQNALLYPEAFSPEEVLVLREKEPLLKENGEVSVRERYVPIKNNIRFAFAAYAKAMRAAFSLGWRQSDWQDFKELFDIRNRIVHPRKDEELFVLDKELDCIKRVLDLVSKSHSAVLETIQKTMWLRHGMPEPLFKNWMSFQEKICKAAHAGRFEKERAALQKKLRAEVEGYFGQHKSKGKG
jgi:hypothetical protein